MPTNPPEGVPQIHPRLAYRDPTKAAPAKPLASLLLALTFCFGGCAHLHREASVQQAASVDSSEGFSEERAARITAGMKAYTDSGDVAGVVTRVQRDGVIVHSDVLG
jgi:hypothetical protein